MRVAVAALLCLAAAKAGAQTFEEAVRTNVTLGVQLCLSGGPNPEAWVASFRAAGFAESADIRDNGDAYFTFTAPADTVSIDVYYGNMPEECSVSTNHLGVTGISAILDQVVPQRFPTYMRQVTQGSIDPATGQPAECVRYEQPNTPIPHVIGVTAGGGAEGCIENGTSRVYDTTLV